MLVDTWRHGATIHHMSTAQSLTDNKILPRLGSPPGQIKRRNPHKEFWLAILSLHLAESKDRRVATILTCNHIFAGLFHLPPPKKAHLGSSLERILRYWIAINLL